MTAIVPIKLTSQRLEYKNFLNFNGKPLYWWILDTLEASDVDDIVITINDERIKDIITGYDYLLRPEGLRGSEITANHLIADVLNRTDDDDYLYTHVTNPLLKVQTINDAIKSYYKYGPLMGVTEHRMRAYIYQEPVNHNPLVVTPSQELIPIYEDNSCLYIFNRDSFERNGRYSDGFYVINKLEAVDIDTIEDFLIAEAIARL